MSTVDAMATDTLKALWREGHTALGAWVSLREPLAAEAAASAGYDYVCIDMQHGLVSIDHTIACLQAIAAGGRGACPVVRVLRNDAGLIGQALDVGAMGVIIPMVNTAQEAAAAVAACRYAPAGSRSIGPMGAATRFGPSYLAVANDHVACIPMIETREAVEHIDKILSVPGIDAVYVGPGDLSLTYGLPPRPDHPDNPEFQGALATVVDACRRHGVTPGIHASAALAATRHAGGFRMITVGFDMQPMVAALRADIATARHATTPST